LRLFLLLLLVTMQIVSPVTKQAREIVKQHVHPDVDKYGIKSSTKCEAGCTITADDVIRDLAIHCKDYLLPTGASLPLIEAKVAA